MAISWGDNIVIAEPAPAAARVARYIAPRPPAIRKTLREDEGNVIAAVAGSIFGAALLFGGVGGIASEIVVALAGVDGKMFQAWAWVVSDIALAALFGTAYALVARYGIRFYTDSPEDEVHLALEVGNTAYRTLPADHRLQEAEALRAMNAAGRILRIDPHDADATTVLRTQSDRLRTLARTILDPAPGQAAGLAAATD
ncbi:hypothetical protein [Streptodolium elevatio]|uniref:Uncharacterized protein n=1 Tax=Streptodolium elevatio TaxID=3157996 RepID=A0ABV3DL74_9ACTN